MSLKDTDTNKWYISLISVWISKYKKKPKGHKFIQFIKLPGTFFEGYASSVDLWLPVLAPRFITAVGKHKVWEGILSKPWHLQKSISKVTKATVERENAVRCLQRNLAWYQRTNVQIKDPGIFAEITFSNLFVSLISRLFIYFLILFLFFMSW